VRRNRADLTVSWAVDAIRGVRLVARLPGLLRQPMSGPTARAALRSRQETRSADFLALLRRAAFGQAASPYARLLAMAGCAYAGYVTPPVGTCLFVACSISREPLSRVLRPLWPYLVVMVLMLAVVTYWPWLTLVGPRLLLRD
jgi:hypothetical protein